MTGRLAFRQQADNSCVEAANFSVSDLLELRQYQNGIGSLLGTTALIAVLSVMAPEAQAQQYWDGTSTSGDADGGDGDWDAATTNWDNAATGGADEAWLDGDAVFGGTAGTVTVVGTQISTGLTFTTTGYTIDGAGEIDLGSGSTIDTGTGTATISSTLTGSGLIKAGTGTLILSGTNTLTGNLNIEKGDVELGSGTALGTISHLDVQDSVDLSELTLDLGGNTISATGFLVNGYGTTEISNGTLSISGTGVLGNGTISAELTGAGGLRKTGQGTGTLEGDHSYTGATTVRQSALYLAVNSSIDSTTVNIGDGLSDAGPAKPVLIAEAGTLASGTNLTIDTSAGLGGEFRNEGHNTIATLNSDSDGTVKLNGGTLTITGGGTMAGQVAGVANLINDGGTLTLSGANNTATGRLTNTNGSTVELSSWSGSIRNFGDLDIQGDLALTGRTFLNTSTGKITNSGNATLALTGITTFTSAGSISAGSTGTITINADNFVYQDGHTEVNSVTINAGTLTEERTGSQTYSGDYGSTNLATNAAGVFATSGTITTTGGFTHNSSATATIDDEFTAASFTNNGTVQQNANVIGTGNTWTNNADWNVADGNSITDVGAIANTGAGTLTFAGSGALNADSDNDGTNEAITNAGAIILSGGAATTVTFTTGGTGGFDNSGTLTIGAGTLDVADPGISNTGTVDLNGGTITGDLTNGGIVTADGAISGLVTNSTNNFTQTGALSVGGLSGGGDIDNGGSLLTLTGLTGTASNTYSGGISGNGGLTVDIGDDTQVLSGTNAYAGLTTLTSGTVSISNDGALGAAAGNVSLNGGTLLSTATTDLTKANFSTTDGTTSTIAAANGTTLTLVGNVNPIGNNSVLQFGAAGQDGTVAVQTRNSASASASIGIIAGTLLIDGASAGNGLMNYIAGTDIAAGATLDMGGYNTIVWSLTGLGTVTNSGAAATLILRQTSTFAGVIQDGAGVTSIDKQVSGTTTLSGTNTYTGSTTVTAGTLQLGGSGVIHDSSDLIVNGGTFDLNDNSETVASLSGTGGSIDLGTGTLTVTQAADLMYSGVISGSGGLTKQGASNLTLSGVNTYSGATTVSSGLLQIDQSLTGGAVVNAGAFLTNNGTISGTVTNNGTVTSASAIFGGFTNASTFNASGSTVVNSAFSNTGTTSMLNGATGDTITVNGNMSGGGQLNLDVDYATNTGDSLLVNGSTSGVTTVSLNSLTTDKPAKGSELTIATVTGSTSASGFVLAGGPLVAGVYSFDLALASGEWALSGRLNGVGEAYETAPIALGELLYMPTLEQRRGQARNLAASDEGESMVGGSWGRVFANKFDAELGTSTSGTAVEANIGGFQAGYDYVVPNGQNGTWVLGLTGQVGTVGSTTSNSTSDAKSVALGATATWFGNDGWYADGQLQLSLLESNFSADGTDLAQNEKGYGLGLSAEVGKRIALTSSSAIVPHAQINWTRLDGGTFTDLSGNSVSMDNIQSKRGRLGLAYEYFDQSNSAKFYAVGSIVHGFSSNNAVVINDVSLKVGELGTWAEVGVGVSKYWGANRKFYAELSSRQSLSSESGSGYGITAGIEFKM